MLVLMPMGTASLPILPVVHDTWAIKSMYPDAYIYAWKHNTAPIAGSQPIAHNMS